MPSDEALVEVVTWTDTFGTNYRYLDDATLKRLRSFGFKVNVWTANGPEAIESIVDRGIDLITTDFPGIAKKVVKGKDPFNKWANGVEVTEVGSTGSLEEGENGQYIEMTNTSDATLDVSGYYLRDSPHHILSIGAGYVLEPDAELRVYTGAGTNTADSYYNNLTTSVLSVAGNSLALWTSSHALIDIFAY